MNGLIFSGTISELERQIAEREWKAADVGTFVSDERLIWGAVYNAMPFKIAKPREGVLSDAFAIGSTSARALCRRFSLDPDEMIEPRHCEACEERYESEREGSD